MEYFNVHMELHKLTIKWIPIDVDSESFKLILFRILEDNF